MATTKKTQQNRILLQETPATDNIFYQEPTFLEHIHEFRRRLFWIIATIFVVSLAAYPFNEALLGALTAPLGAQQLYYLTPVGGLSFIIKLCMYVGIFAALPVVVYHLYQYLAPLMGKWRRSVVYYTAFSAGLAIIGMLFAYFIFLPGALHFLTGFDIGHIQAMLTVDSYLSFVMTYLLGGAILFQIPLIMLIINTIRPIPPRKLLGAERFVILGAFIAAAIISPTPDIMNQTLFALPIIGMYQVGLFMVWMQQRKKVTKQELAVQHTQVKVSTGIPEDVLQDLLSDQPTMAASVAVKQSMPTKVTQLDIVPLAQQVSSQPKPVALRPAPRTITVPKRQVDGFMPHAS